MVFPWDVQGVYRPSLRILNWRDEERKFCIQAGHKQVHLGNLPYLGNLFEDLWRYGPLCGLDLISPGESDLVVVAPSHNSLADVRILYRLVSLCTTPQRCCLRQ